jgi:predicted nuclease of predicted toxin-antitoxin system
MTFHALKFLTDENIHPTVIDFLKANKLDALSLADYSLNGKPDSDILKVALNETRVVITQDADFGKLVFADENEFIGIIYLRPGHISSDFHIKTIQAIIREELDLQPPFILVADNRGEQVKIRLRNSIR